MKKLVLIDGNSLINRAYYAVASLSNSEGIPTNAVYGFCNMLVRVITDTKPEYLGVCFDVRAPTFRHKMYSEYKAGRKPMPEDLVPQIPLLKSVLKKMNICVLEKEGIEADDILGVLSKRFSEHTIIVTGDRDALQLVDSSTEVWLTKKGLSDILQITPKNIVEEYGVSANGVIDLKSLMGDKSDNIPGVKGIGEVIAKKLLSEYGDLDGVYANLDKVAVKLKEKLERDKEMAYLSYKLATIDVNQEIECSIDDLKYDFPFSEDVYSEFKRLEFSSLIRRDNLFDFSVKTKETVGEKVYIKDIKELIKLESLSSISIYIDDEYIHVCGDSETEYLIKIRHSLIDDGLDYLETLGNLISNALHIVVFDYKSFYKHLKANGLSYAGAYDDIALLGYVLGNSGMDSVKNLLEKYGYRGEHIALDMLTLFNLLKGEVISAGSMKLYSTELEVSLVLEEMEQVGILVDTKVLEKLRGKYSLQLDELTKKIHEIAGEVFNINSPQQLGKIFFEKLGLKSERMTKRGYATDNEVLESLQGEHEIIPFVMLYRQYSKLLSTYIDGIAKVMQSDNTVHTEYKQFLTFTGRLSSTEPNLQNIPQTPQGKEVRAMFVASGDNSLLVSADYSQIELRLLAHLSGDAALIEAFNAGVDIHSLTASRIFGVSLSEVTTPQRRQAKAINFGIVYGKGEYSLGKELSISRQEAKSFIDGYFDAYPGVKGYLMNVINTTKDTGKVETMFHRIRKMPEIKSSNFQTRAHAERAATNMPLQGSAADVMKIAMCNVHNRMIKEKLRSKLILQVHDELIVNAVEDEIDIVKCILKEEMESVAVLLVPLTVDVSASKNWLEV